MRKLYISLCTNAFVQKHLYGRFIQLVCTNAFVQNVKYPVQTDCTTRYVTIAFVQNGLPNSLYINLIQVFCIRLLYKQPVQVDMYMMKKNAFMYMVYVHKLKFGREHL